MSVFTVVALVELAVFLLIESQIGLVNSLVIALLTAVIGSWLVRRAGTSVWTDLRRRMAEGGMPGRELTHAAAVLVAGAFLMSPGFLTDIFGFLLLIPAVRDLIHRQITRRLEKRVTVMTTGTGTRMTASPPRSAPEIIDVEGWEEPPQPTIRPPGALPPDNQ